jgi:hypothetical protein
MGEPPRHGSGLYRALAWVWAHAVLALGVGVVGFCVGYFVYVGWLIAS